MIDPVSLQMVRDVVAIFGVIAGFSYYVLTVRNANRARKQMIARDFYQDFGSVENQRIFMELLQMEWDDYEDYLKKTSENKEINAQVLTILGSFESFGIMLRYGFIDANLLADFAANAIIRLWEKYPLLEFRERNGNPRSWVNFEYLYHEMKKLRPEIGEQTV